VAFDQIVFNDDQLLIHLKDKKIDFNIDKNGMIHILEDFTFPLKSEYGEFEFRQVNLSRLASCKGTLDIIDAYDVDISSLVQAGNLILGTVQSCNASSLKKTGTLEVCSGNITFSALEETDRITTGPDAYCFYPSLRKSGHIQIRHKGDLAIPLLKEAGNIVVSADQAFFPSLHKCWHLGVPHAKHLEIPVINACKSMELYRHEDFQISENIVVGRTSFHTIGMFNTNKKSIKLNESILDHVFCSLDIVKKRHPKEDNARYEQEAAFLEYCKNYKPGLSRYPIFSMN